MNRLSIIDPLLRSSLLMAASRLMSLLVLIAVAPLVVAQLGVEGYGVWEAIATIQSSIAVLHSVVGAVCLLAFSRLHGAGTSSEAQELASRLRGGFLIVGAVTTILFGGMGLALVSVVKAPPEALVHAQLATVWTALACGLATINQVTVAIIAGCQRTGSAALIQSIGTMIGAVAIVVSLKAGWGLLSLPMGITAGAIATELLAARAALALLGSVSFAGLSLPTTADFHNYGRYALMLLLTSATVLFRDQVDRLLIASTETAVATAALAISARAGSIVLQLAAALLTPMAAAIGAQLAKGDLAACRALYQRYSQLLIVLVGSIAISVVWLREPLLVAWLGESLDGAAPFIGWSLLGVMAATLLSAPAMIFARASGDAKPELWAAIATLTLVLLSKPLATLAFGGVGATASSALSWAVGSAIFLAIVHARFALPAGTAGRLVAATVLTSALLALSYWAPVPGPPRGRWTALAHMLIWTGPITLSYLAALALLGVIDGRSLLWRPQPSPATQLTATPLSASRSGDAQRLYRKSA